MKLLNRYTIIALLLSLGIVSNAQVSNKDESEFLFAVVELSSQKDGSISVKVLNSKVVAQPLKTPTESEGDGKKSNGFSVLIKDSENVVLDEIIYDDVFKTDYEYVNEEGKLQHHKLVSKKKTILLRRNIDPNATSLSFYKGSNLKSNSLLNFNFRK